MGFSLRTYIYEKSGALEGFSLKVDCFSSLSRLRTFARKFSNIDFCLKFLPLKDDKLAMSEMQK